ncbi:hypothetical protein Pint_08609 [Pistacia integerrima]|uniref:Uncharacterized protein n=1 Tax=Pistacia integerrima TaxID=434235 RepID=A0ACC0XVF2_9ROSI|nr:hypothetical protein Pint_08609 [Pistacia integerrima]
MDSDLAKLFVGGISRETNEETLRCHFSKYGTVLGSVIARERITKNPRGFGFVWFCDTSAADEALKDGHVILGRTVDVKRAIPRSEQHQDQQKQQHYPNEQQNSLSIKNTSNGEIDNHIRTKKIFVGGLSANLTEEEFKNYFERFGRIIDVVVMHDNMTNRPRGFGFVTYDSEESVENVMQKTFHELNGRLVEVKRAVPKEEINGSTGSSNARFGIGKGSPFRSFRSGNCPPYSPGYGVPPYALLPGHGGVGGFPGGGILGGGYPMVVYGKYGYGVPPIAPRSPWYGPAMIRSGACPVPYGNASIFPAYLNGRVGVMGMTAGGYNGTNGAGVDGKLSQVRGGSEHLLANAAPSHIEGVKLDVECTDFKGSNDGGSSEQNQKGVDGRFKPVPVGFSR